MKQLLPILRPYRWMALVAAVLVFTRPSRNLPAHVDGEHRRLRRRPWRHGTHLSVGAVMVVVAAFGMTAAFFGARLAALVAVGFARDLRNRLFPTSPPFRCTSLTR